jgi:hypothetical protein
MVCAAFVEVSVSLGRRDRKSRSEDREGLETLARTENSRKAEEKRYGVEGKSVCSQLLFLFLQGPSGRGQWNWIWHC